MAIGAAMLMVVIVAACTPTSALPAPNCAFNPATDAGYNNFSGCALPGVDWTNLTLSGDTFVSTDLDAATLTDARFVISNMTNVNASRANLSGANLSGADVTGANLVSARLSNANLAHVVGLTPEQLEGAAHATPASYVYLYGIDLSGDYLAGLSGYFNFAQATLIGTNLSGSTIVTGTFAGANLTGADLSHSQLSYEVFASSNLTNANFTGAILTGDAMTQANLSGANFADADLTGVNLNGATLTGATFSGATFSHTLCPNGTTTITSPQTLTNCAP